MLFLFRPLCGGPIEGLDRGDQGKGNSGREGRKVIGLICARALVLRWRILGAEAARAAGDEWERVWEGCLRRSPRGSSQDP